MTQPDRRHLRRARLAPCRRGRRRSGRLAVVSWRAYLSAAESDGVSLPGSAAGQRVYRRLGAAGPRWSHCADDPPGDRRSAAGFPDYPGERRPVRRLLGRGAVVVQRHGRGRALLASPERWGAKWWRNSPAARCCAVPTAISPALARRRSWSAACCRLSRLTRSACRRTNLAALLAFAGHRRGASSRRLSFIPGPGVCSPGAPSGWPPGFRCFCPGGGHLYH